MSCDPIDVTEGAPEMREIALFIICVGCGNQVVLGVAVARWSCEDPESESNFGDIAVEASEGWGLD
jgi:hypothetical protein